MDISSYIGELLFEHDCVIVPGFGGFICSYRAAGIHPVTNTISPPSKRISFNRHLQSNDGLLVNYVATSLGISFDAATSMVNGWAASSNNQIAQGEEITVRKIGRFYNDVEKNLQFTPFNEVNYLRTSFGLPSIVAEPVLREKEIEFTDKFADETKQVHIQTSRWRIAATVALFISLGVLGTLMWQGVEIKGLELNQAGVFSFISNLFKVEQPVLEPIAIESKSAPEVNNANNAAVSESQPVESTTTNSENVPGVIEENAAPVSTEQGPVYYIVVGAFAEEGNLESAREKLQAKFPDSLILVEKGKRVTRLGYSVGHNLATAREQLTAAQAEDSSFWLLKK